MAGTRRGVRVGALVTAVLFGWVGPVAAAPAIEDLVVAPPGAEAVRAREVADAPARTDSFLDNYPELDVQVVDTEVGVLSEGTDRTVAVTVVRLASPAQARAAFEALHGLRDERLAWTEGPVHGVGTRSFDEREHGGFHLFERYRAVGPDLVVWAEMLPKGQGASSLLERAVDAHLDAYPPDDGRSRLPWIAAVTVALALVAVALVVRRRRRTAPPSAPRVGTPSASAPRVNW